MLKRNAICSFMDISGTLYAIGDGFTSFALCEKPIECTRRYINEDSARTDTVGYASEITYAFEGICEDAVCAHLMEITAQKPLHDGASVDIVTVFTHETAANGLPLAAKQSYAVCPDSVGEGCDALVYKGTLKARAPMVMGTFDAEKKAFLPN